MAKAEEFQRLEKKDRATKEEDKEHNVVCKS